MAESFGVSPHDLRATSLHLSDVSSTMRDVMESLRTNLGREGAAWGDDEMGNQFANGEAGYLAQLDWAGGSVDAKTGLLDFYAAALKVASDSFERNDGS